MEFLLHSGLQLCCLLFSIHLGSPPLTYFSLSLSLSLFFHDPDNISLHIFFLMAFYVLSHPLLCGLACWFSSFWKNWVLQANTSCQFMVMGHCLGYALAACSRPQPWYIQLWSVRGKHHLVWNDLIPQQGFWVGHLPGEGVMFSKDTGMSSKATIPY